MAGICFFYEDSDVDVWSGKDLDAWNYACKIAGDIDKAIIVNRTDQILGSFDSTMDIQFVQDLPSAEDLMSGAKMYLMCPWDAGHPQSIEGHSHDVDWYVFGPASGWNDDSISGYYLPQAGTGAAHAVHIATTVMFYRYAKTNSTAWAHQA